MASLVQSSKQDAGEQAKGRETLLEQPIVAGALRDIRAAADLLAPALTSLAREELHVLHLDAGLALIGHDLIEGGGCVVRIPLRALFRDALAIGSRAMILAHNHPNGDPHPGEADRRTTRRIVEVAAALDIAVIDHLIFGRPDWVSFRRLGLM